MKIFVTGTRGIPEIQGGVETHCQELYPRLAAMGHDITVACREPYVTVPGSEYRGVKLISIPTPRSKSLEAIIHTWRALMAARRVKPDIVHIHAVGPSLLTPVARLMGFKVVTTNHGPDYERQKWGRLAKTVIRLGERMGAKFSNRIIVISDVIARILADNYGRRDTALIFNGVNIPEKTADTDYIAGLGLEPGRYVVAVGRFVEEKGFHDLIKAFAKAAPEGFKLAIAGDADHPDAYSENLKRMARDNGVVLTGFIRGEKMRQLMSHAALFAMPSYHEGLPIALLEAMSYDLDIAVSDIPACRIDAVNPETDSFPVGDTDALARLITRKLADKATPRSYNLEPYNWDTIARQTADLYKSILTPRP